MTAVAGPQKPCAFYCHDFDYAEHVAAVEGDAATPAHTLALDTTPVESIVVALDVETAVGGGLGSASWTSDVTERAATSASAEPYGGLDRAWNVFYQHNEGMRVSCASPLC